VRFWTDAPHKATDILQSDMDAAGRPVVELQGSADLVDLVAAGANDRDDFIGTDSSAGGEPHVSGRCADYMAAREA